MREFSATQQAILQIASAQGLTYRQKAALMSLCDKPEELFSHLYSYRDEISEIGQGIFEKLEAVRDRFDPVRLQNYMEKIGVNVVFRGENDFPASFEYLEECPEVLFYKGDIGLLSEECFAVVGTRAPTRYGRDVTEQFTREISKAGFVIVSGLARGVDAIAHRTALEEGSPTIAVIGCGIDVVYPAENKQLYDDIGERGLILTEYYFGEAALPYHFPERNRLISMLSQGILVTEAGIKSGTMITVNYALDQGKDVFLVPGNVFSAASKGTNEMLHNPQCMIACSADDVLTYYKRDVKKQEEEAVQLTASEVMVYSALQDDDKHFEELIAATGLSMGELMATLTKLEILGVIKRLPGNYYGI